jgi:predicted ATPase with chaperone activity
MSKYLTEALRQARAERAAAEPLAKATDPTEGFGPLEPADFLSAGLDVPFVETLVLKHLLSFPRHTGRQITQAIALPLGAMNGLLQALKLAKKLVIKQSTQTGDFQYDLSEEGRSEARELLRQSRYAGPAPVPLSDYLESVRRQSMGLVRPSERDVARAFEDLLVPPALLRKIGPALSSGKGLFLYGDPGNGKTSLAQRMTRAFGDAVWIPAALMVDGMVIKLYDPVLHKSLASPPGRWDRRWVYCQRPTVIAGGELTLEQLEVQLDERLGVCEAPIQLKANCGTLVIDDFGRQRCSPSDLLNRWIVPLEHRVDYLRMPDGKKIEVPFDPLVVFSTNLDPKDLVDEAFLRRIPYKLKVGDPDEATFLQLLRQRARDLGFPLDETVFLDLLQRHFISAGRPLRFCHPRDLLQQVYHQRRFREQPLKLTAVDFDEAVDTYFSLM